jgi:hypothetical protein
VDRRSEVRATIPRMTLAPEPRRTWTDRAYWRRNLSPAEPRRCPIQGHNLNRGNGKCRGQVKRLAKCSLGELFGRLGDLIPRGVLRLHEADP